MNGYQSIHTTIYTGDGGTLEIQIRSKAMHREAQYGIASHLSYKESSGYLDAKKGSGLEWIRQFFPGGKTITETAPATNGTQYHVSEVPGWVKELAETTAAADEDGLNEIKTDFFSHRVFTFTPQNDVIDLPVNATPIDFAYTVHSDIGNHLSGAKVNGKLVSLDTPLKNGDIVEIVTKRSAKPSPKWLDIARTTMAKRHIRQSLSAQKQ